MTACRGRVDTGGMSVMTVTMGVSRDQSRAVPAQGVAFYPHKMYVPGMKDGSPHESGNLRKVTVNLTERSMAAATVAMNRTGDTRTDVINRAVQVYAWLQAEIDAGGELMIRKGDELERIRLV